MMHFSFSPRFASIALCLCAAIMLSGCSSTMDRLENVGRQPALTRAENPQSKQNYQPVTWPMPQPTPPGPHYANSLWQPGARAFFRDQRAARVGDIVRVRIQINDRADVLNNTNRNRIGSEEVGAPNVLGLEKYFSKLSRDADPEALLGIDSNSRNVAQGLIRRQERINTVIAAAITQVLPNGHFVISGSQEMRINFEIREVGITGIIRPEDIDSSNTIDSTQVAEARVIYGGRGQITDIQQSRWGAQVVDILSPF